MRSKIAKKTLNDRTEAWFSRPRRAVGLARDRAKVFRVIHPGSISTTEVLLSSVVAFPVIHLRIQDASQVLLTGVKRAGE